MLPGNWQTTAGWPTVGNRVCSANKLGSVLWPGGFRFSGLLGG